MDRIIAMYEQGTGVAMVMQWDFCFKLVFATFLGCVLGMERTRKYKSAGVRIYGLVAVGSCLIMLISKYAFLNMSYSGDPSRVAASVVSGISFICLAIIYRQGTALRGLSTAAGLWCVSAVGLAVGGGLYIPAVASVIIMLLLQSIMHKLKIDNDSMTQRDVTIVMADDEKLRQEIRKELLDAGCEISGRKLIHNGDGTMAYTFVLRMSSLLHFEDVIAMMNKHTQVKSISTE